MALKEREVPVVVYPVDGLGIVMPTVITQPGMGEPLAPVFQDFDVVTYLLSGGFGDVLAIYNVIGIFEFGKGRYKSCIVRNVRLGDRG